MKKKSLFVLLDLDETLLYRTYRTDEPVLPREPDFQISNFNVYLRPMVRDFLRLVEKHGWMTGVFTAATKEDAEEIVAELFPRRPSLLLCREDCQAVQESPSIYAGASVTTHIKYLSILEAQGIDLSRTVVIDDRPQMYSAQHRRNVVPVRPYYGEANDDELLMLVNYLCDIRDYDDVRHAPKLSWRELLDDEPTIEL